MTIDRRSQLIAALSLSVLIGLVAVTLRARDGARPRRISIPQSMGAVSLRTDLAAADFAASMKPLLRDMFGKAPAASAQYGAEGGIANLIAGRGRMDMSRSGDVRAAAPRPTTFGKITCASMIFGEVHVESAIVCWYLSESFSASLSSFNSITPVFASMAEQAAALEAAIPVIRDEASG